MTSMQHVYAIFELLKESTWIESIDRYGYDTFSMDMIPMLISELFDSTWADNLEVYRRDIVEKGCLIYLSVPEMKQIFEKEVAMYV